MTLRRGKLNGDWEAEPEEAGVADARPNSLRVSPVVAVAGFLVLATVIFLAATSAASGDVPAAGQMAQATVTPDAMSTSTGPRPELTIVKLDSPDPAAIGGPISYTITVSNVGPVEAEGVRVVDEPPAGVRIIASTPQQGECEGFVCELGTVAAGESTAISIVVLVEEGAQNPLTNSACVSMSGDEFDVTNNCDMEETSLPGGASPTALPATFTPAPVLPIGGGGPMPERGGGSALLLAGWALLIAGAATIGISVGSYRPAPKPLWPGWRD